MSKCDYCKGTRTNANGWHSCSQAQAAKCRLQASLTGIHTMMAKPGSQLLTSNQMKAREDRRHHIATSIRINGGNTAPEYAQNGNE